MADLEFHTPAVVERLRRNGVEVVDGRAYAPPGGHLLSGEVLVGLLDRIGRRRAAEIEDWEG